MAPRNDPTGRRRTAGAPIDAAPTRAGADNAVPIRRLAGALGQATIEPLSCGGGEVPLVRCDGCIDDGLFHAIYDMVSAGHDGRVLHLVVDLREADMLVGFDGYARAARLVRQRGIGTVMAVICDPDMARPLDAKAGQEMAAVHGLRVVQRVIGRLEDAAAMMADMMGRDRSA